MRIRPCIDIHNGLVKQIVGSSLSEDNSGMSRPAENFVAQQSAAFFATLYREKGLPGGHVILLNSRTDREAYEADVRQALEALRAWPGGLQAGGGITPESAGIFLDAGASHVIVTSYVFTDGKLDRERLLEMEQACGRERLVLDLSCRRCEDGLYRVVTDRWQKRTDLVICGETLDDLREHADEFLVHAADVEGRRGGIETELAGILGEWSRRNRYPVTYAGGVHAEEDLDLLSACSGGALDVTVGSALDLFGGNLTLDALAARAERLS